MPKASTRCPPMENDNMSEEMEEEEEEEEEEEGEREVEAERVTEEDEQGEMEGEAHRGLEGAEEEAVGEWAEEAKRWKQKHKHRKRSPPPLIKHSPPITGYILHLCKCRSDSM